MPPGVRHDWTKNVKGNLYLIVLYIENMVIVSEDGPLHQSHHLGGGEKAWLRLSSNILRDMQPSMSPEDIKAVGETNPGLVRLLRPCFPISLESLAPF